MQEVGPHHERNLALRLRRTERNKLYIQQLKSISRCKDCGARKGLTFDHLPQFEKSDTISNLVTKTSLARVRREIAKCELVCMSCHQRRENARGISNHKVD